MFKIGDRVRVIENGLTGTVVEVFRTGIKGYIVELDDDGDENDGLFDCHEYEVELIDERSACK